MLHFIFWTQVETEQDADRGLKHLSQFAGEVMAGYGCSFGSDKWRGELLVAELQDLAAGEQTTLTERDRAGKAGRSRIWMEM